MNLRKRQSSRGFSIIEMMSVIVIIGLIMLMLGYEFVSVVNSTLHTRANTDAESQARLIMSKVETHMRNAYFDYSDFGLGGPTADPVVSPVPGASAGYVLFYRTVPGQLTPGMKTCGTNQPCPVFESVLIQLNPSVPGELDETDTQEPNGTPPSPTVLGTNVSNFSVSGTSSNRYDISLTVSEPSGHCAGKACTFQLDDVLYVGGTQ